MNQLNRETPRKIACFDDHPILLDGLCTLLAGRPGFSVVARGGHIDVARSVFLTVRPDLMFLDLHMPGDVVGEIRSMVARSGATRFIVYTASGDSDAALRCLDAGAQGFVVKDSLPEEIIEAAEQVLDGDVYISRRYAGRILADLRGRGSRDVRGAQIKLSAREAQVAELLVKAKSNKEIANILEISEKTVKHYMTNLMTKLDAKNRVEVALATQFRSKGGEGDRR